MKPQPAGWLSKMKKLEPARLIRNIMAILAVASLLGYVGLTQAQITFLGTQLEIILPLVGAVLWPVVKWIATRWLRSKVASPNTAETLAVVVLNVEKARGDGAPVNVLLKATRAAKRVLKIDPERVENPL